MRDFARLAQQTLETANANASLAFVILDVDTRKDGWYYFGQHSLRFEPPDLVYFRPVGHASFADGHTFMRWVEKHAQKDRGIYLLTDVSRGTSQSSEIIKSKDIMERIRGFRALAYFGASFHARTAIGIYMRIARFFGLPLADLPLAFFSSEREARAWLDECRATTSKKT